MSVSPISNVTCYFIALHAFSKNWYQLCTTLISPLCWIHLISRFPPPPSYLPIGSGLFCDPVHRTEPDQAGFMFPFFIVVAVLYPVSNVIGSLVKEKEMRIKEGLKMMGLTGAAHTASWVFHFSCLFFFISLLMTLVSGSLFENRLASRINNHL